MCEFFLSLRMFLTHLFENEKYYKRDGQRLILRDRIQSDSANSGKLIVCLIFWKRLFPKFFICEKCLKCNWKKSSGNCAHLPHINFSDLLGQSSPNAAKTNLALTKMYKSQWKLQWKTRMQFSWNITAPKIKYWSSEVRRLSHSYIKTM